MKFGAQLESYAIPAWQDQYIRYNALKKFLKDQLASRKSSPLGFRLPSLSRRGSFSKSPSELGVLIQAASGLGGQITPAPSLDPVGQMNREFMKLLDDELIKVERHFTLEMSFLVDRLGGVEEELSAIHEEERVDELATMTSLREDEDEASAAGSRSSRIDFALSQSSFLEPRITSYSSVTDRRRQVDEVSKEEAQSLQSPSHPVVEVDRVRVAKTKVLKELQQHSGRQTRQMLQERKSRKKQRASHRQGLSRAVVAIWDCLEKLEGFIQLNVVALYKIIKKRDKLLGLNNLTVDLPVKKRRLSLLIVPQSIKDALVRLYNATASEKHQDAAALDMQSLSMSVQKQFVTAPGLVSSAWVPFSLGVCVTICVDILLVAFIPATNPSFSYSVLLTLFPLFRVTLMVALIAWGALGAIGTFEHYGVNYRFILDIDPKCAVSSQTLFMMAGLLTFVWVLGFGGFLVDYRFGLLLPSNQLWIYPLSVILSQLVICLLPSKTFRYSYRRRLVGIVGSTLYDGVDCRRKVTLVNNIVGDMLTSLPKVALDFQYTLIYFCGFYFSDDTAADILLEANWINMISVPIVTLIPYWIRFSQCYSRFRNEQHDMRHVHAANMGKYFSVILVIFTTNIHFEFFGLMSVYAARLIFVSTYLVASLYGLVWDVIMDWGLLPDPDNFVRPDHRIMYPQWLYYGITLFNLVGRLTWALTLIPIGFLSDYRFNASMITLAISSLEILRRSAWLVLRLENEHLTNSSRYRAMLWVPKMTLTHPEINLYVDSGPSVLHQALKRFATARMDVLSGSPSHEAKEDAIALEDSTTLRDSLAPSKQRSQSMGRRRRRWRTSVGYHSPEVLKLLQSAAPPGDFTPQTESIIALPPTTPLDSVLSEQQMLMQYADARATRGRVDENHQQQREGHRQDGMQHTAADLI